MHMYLFGVTESGKEAVILTEARNFSEAWDMTVNRPELRDKFILGQITILPLS